MCREACRCFVLQWLNVAPKKEQFNVHPKMFDTYLGGLTYLTQTRVSQEVLHE